MNLAGIAVAEILRDNDISPSDLIVCHDDIDLPLGKLRIKEGGGFGGHKGVKSLIESLQTDRFVRVKIGVGRPLFPVDVSEYVLGEFSDKEKGVIRMAILRAADAVLMIIKRGVAAAMNHFNVYREG
jgi:PTH1 family peptidyl-tRNA hydrolase